MVIVGSTVPVSKVVTLDLPIYLALTVRFFVGTLFLYLFIKLKGVKIEKMPLREFLLIGFQAMLGSVLFNVFLLAGLKSASAVSSGIVTGSLPAVLMVLSVLILRERLSAIKISGVALATLGVIAVNISGLSAGGGSMTGTLLVLAAVVCEALFLLIRKMLPLNVSSLVLSLIVSFYGFVFFLPFGVYEAYQGGFSVIDFSGYMLIAYYGIFITAVAYILWFKGISMVESSYASVYTAFMPLSAVILSALFLHEEITAMHTAGMVLIISATIIMSLNSFRK